MSFDLLSRRATHFVLWCPRALDPAPVLVIGTFQAGTPPVQDAPQRLTMLPAAGVTGLWELAAADCALIDGTVYHYWFEVVGSYPGRDGKPLLCADPLAYTVDWRLIPPPLEAPLADEDRHPACIVRFAGGQLQACDAGGELPVAAATPPADLLPANNAMVIYEMPTAWSRSAPGSLGIGAGSFQDVRALIDRGAMGKNFSDLEITGLGQSYLVDLGINALELLPPADSLYKREWGYDTAHYFAPDAQLGQPEGYSWPTANTDLRALVDSCHNHGIRFFVDAVMAFSRAEAYQQISFEEFYICPDQDPTDPDALNSRSTPGSPQLRNPYGGASFRYVRPMPTPLYDPETGTDQPGVIPARELMYMQLTHWMQDFPVDGYRLDSVENVANWDFVQGFKDRARALWNERWTAQGLAGTGNDRFLVVGEELSLPMGLLQQNRLDGLWNDPFLYLVRGAVLGQGDPASFETNVRKLIDCRALGFADGAQAVNYITSHDVEGENRSRLFTHLTKYNGLSQADAAPRIQLAFVCLLTAVGVPMILAGEEFGDEHDRFDVYGNVSQDGGKQVAPVHYDLVTSDAWRGDLCGYVSRLIKLRTGCQALAVNDNDFLHTDFNDSKRVLVWQRGPGADGSLVVVIANFSDWGTDLSAGAGAEYVVPNWPGGRQWREITQSRDVPAAWAGREPLYPWEAKVYVTV